MRLALAALLLIPPLAASAPAMQAAEPLDDALTRARAEQAAAERQAANLERQAAAAKDEAGRLRAQQAAAAQALDAAEAGITAAEAQYRIAAAHAAAYRQRLSAEQRPISSLLAGLATMARRPPLLALADQGGADELVRVGVLLDSTLPVIRQRTQALSAQLARGERLEVSALSARAELVRSRQALASRRQRFAALERQAFDRSIAAGGQALSAGDVAISADEQVARLKSEATRRAEAAQIARLLAAEQPAPPRPTASPAASAFAPFAYRLPVAAPVVQGLGAVDESGVRSRGVSFATARGTAVSAPGAGIVRFSGPFRDYDGVLIIDHGGGWLSVIVNVASPLKAGERVEAGASIGRALGPLELQLSRNGQLVSPALIAGSSQSLSKDRKGS
ncbi:MAG TPA: peptidoglycan DD-metalloendopeptidase family protein [Sphingomicrobium sp.]|jgi:septal ring factor EnvC (AmiA/AmiB activator)